MNDNPGWIHVARKDLEDAARSKLLGGLMGVLILIGIALSALPNYIDHPVYSDAEYAAVLLQSPVSLFLPILGAMIGYMAIISERDSGSIRVLLGLPLRRADVLLGKVIGRSLVLVGALVVAGIVGVLTSMVLYGDVDGQSYAAFGIVGAILAVVYVSVAIGISASMNSRGKAMAAVATVLVLFAYVWQYLVLALIYISEGTGFLEVPDFAVFLFALDPNTAANRTANLVFPGTIQDPWGGLSQQIGEVPWYLEQWVAIPILLLWIVVPLAIGYYRFANADL